MIGYYIAAAIGYLGVGILTLFPTFRIYQRVRGRETGARTTMSPGDFWAGTILSFVFAFILALLTGWLTGI